MISQHLNDVNFLTITANIPKAEALIARLMVLAGRPQNGRNRGIHVLTLMQGLVPNLNDQLVELWDTVIPKLVQYLEGLCYFAIVIFIFTVIILKQVSMY